MGLAARRRGRDRRACPGGRGRGAARPLGGLGGTARVRARLRPDAADLRIRAALWSDAPALGPLLEQLPRSLRIAGPGAGGGPGVAIGADGSRNLVVERARCAIVAFGIVEGVGAPRALLTVAVADDHRRYGLAGILVERLAAAAWAEGTRRVVVRAPVAAHDLRALLARRCARP